MQPHFNKLSPDEQKAFRLYKANTPIAGGHFFADFVNESLRDGRALPDDVNRDASFLDSIIDKAKLDEPTTLYRATVDHFVVPYVSDRVLIYPAYMSTTDELVGIERHFSGSLKDIPAALLQIECPKGAVALDLETNAAFGGHEREYLLPRGARFLIHGVEEITDTQMMNERMTPFYAKNYSALKIYRLQYEGRV
nr:hypothetical protein [uncultured bacterium]BAJ06959.1 hypothetical protein [uncultured bacterium]